MKRKLLEARINEIIRYIQDDNLANIFGDTLGLFSEQELNELLGFLESGDYSIIYSLVEKKVNEYNDLFDKIQILNSEIKIEKSRSIEQQEREQESIEADNLLQL